MKFKNMCKLGPTWSQSWLANRQKRLFSFAPYSRHPVCFDRLLTLARGSAPKPRLGLALDSVIRPSFFKIKDALLLKWCFVRGGCYQAWVDTHEYSSRTALGCLMLALIAIQTRRIHRGVVRSSPSDFPQGLDSASLPDCGLLSMHTVFFCPFH